MIDEYLSDSLGEGTRHVTGKGIQYSYKCPLCNDYKERLFINYTKGVCHCHNCGYSNSLISFISDYIKIPYLQALGLFREYEGYSRPLPENLEQEIYSKLANISVDDSDRRYIHPLPEEFIPIIEAQGKSGNRAIKYLKSRGITYKMCERYNIGYCSEGIYKDRIIMPDYEDGKLIYWQARTWLEAPSGPLKKYYRKVLNPSLSEEQLSEGYRDIGKSEILGNIDLIKKERVAVLVEGKMDGYTMGDIGAVLHGKVMSDIQFMKLVSNKEHIDTIFICLDGDAFSYALSTAKRLYQHFNNILVCHLNGDEDPNSLGVKGCREALSKAEEYTPMFDIKCRLKGWV